LDVSFVWGDAGIHQSLASKVSILGYQLVAALYV